MSTFAQLGVDMQRIRSVLREGVCDCGCSMPANDLFRVCSYFWKLPKAAQDACLWSIQSECKQRRRRWFLEGLFGGGVIADFCMDNITSKWVWVCFHMTSGHPMCKEAWLRFLGVGNDRLLRCKKTYNGLDKRSLTCGGGFWVIFKIDSVNLNDSKHTIQAYPKAKSPNFFSHCLNCFSFSPCRSAQDLLPAQLSSELRSKGFLCISTGLQLNALLHRNLVGLARVGGR